MSPEPRPDVSTPVEPRRRRRVGAAFVAPPPGGWALWVREATARLADGANADLAAGAGAPLLAAVFAAGIAAYFSLPAEPSLAALVGLAVLLAGTTAVRRRRGARAIGGMVFAAFVAGAAVAAVGAHLAAAPRLDRERTVAVEGRVVDLDGTARGGTRMTIDVHRMEANGLPPEAVPERITATLAAHAAAPAVGSGVAFKARLKPPAGPVLPGGYDFARRAWFEGRGASGYVLGKARPIDLGPAPLVGRVTAPIGDLRHAVAERVRAQLPGGTGAIAAAIMVGEQRAIPESVGEPLRASGLTHIVSISGLHMSLVAGGVMVVLRLLFVAVPGFALGHSAKKWAAAAALVVGTAYLMLSGMQVAALRSHIMVAIALFAVMVDRPAITMHTVALAAVAILLVDPEAAMEPSFRMSFLAVIALVASWDLWKLRVAQRPPRPEARGPLAHALVQAIRHAEGLAFSSLVAGLATAPVIAGVFHRGAPYSILANMIVLPVVGMVVMPMAVVAGLLMPFGLDGAALVPMGLGIDWMVGVGRFFSGLPGGGGEMGAPHGLAMPLGIAAVLWISLWRSPIRLFAIVPALLSVALLWFGPKPDVIVARDGGAVAVRAADGRLAVLGGRDEAFDVAIWLAADADGRSFDPKAVPAGWRCDGVGCVFARGDDAAGGALTVAVVRDPRGFPEDCARADVIVSRLAAPPGCAATSLVLDRPARAATGAVTLTVSGRSEAAPEHREGWAADGTEGAADGRSAEATGERAASGGEGGGGAGVSRAAAFDSPRTGASGTRISSATVAADPTEDGAPVTALDPASPTRRGDADAPASTRGAQHTEPRAPPATVRTGDGRGRDAGTTQGDGDAHGAGTPEGGRNGRDAGTAQGGSDGRDTVGAQRDPGRGIDKAPQGPMPDAPRGRPEAGRGNEPGAARERPSQGGRGRVGDRATEPATQERPISRPIFVLTAALPATPRPWTPRDPFAARLAEEVRAELQPEAPVDGAGDGSTEAEPDPFDAGAPNGPPTPEPQAP